MNAAINVIQLRLKEAGRPQGRQSEVEEAIEHRWGQKEIEGDREISAEEGIVGGRQRGNNTNGGGEAEGDRESLGRT